MADRSSSSELHHTAFFDKSEQQCKSSVSLSAASYKDGYHVVLCVFIIAAFFNHLADC